MAILTLDRHHVNCKIARSQSISSKAIFQKNCAKCVSFRHVTNEAERKIERSSESNANRVIRALYGISPFAGSNACKHLFTHRLGIRSIGRYLLGIAIFKTSSFSYEIITIA